MACRNFHERIGRVKLELPGFKFKFSLKFVEYNLSTFKKKNLGRLLVHCCAHRTRRFCQKYDEDFFFQILWPSQNPKTLIFLLFFSRHEYNRILSEINEKHAEEEEINAILQDWKLLAQKVDYILFWVFLCLTTVSSCIFIFILPYFKRGKLL